MTEREKFRIAEAKERIFHRDRYTCRICGGSIMAHGTPQLAHRVPQTVTNIKRYGKRIIHHDDNLWSVCSLACNSRALTSNPEAVAQAIQETVNDERH